MDVGDDENAIRLWAYVLIAVTEIYNEGAPHVIFLTCLDRYGQWDPLRIKVKDIFKILQQSSLFFVHKTS